MAFLVLVIIFRIINLFATRLQRFVFFYALFIRGRGLRARLRKINVSANPDRPLCDVGARARARGSARRA